MKIAITGLTGFLGHYVAKSSSRGTFTSRRLYGTAAMSCISRIIRKNYIS